jgi:hypothetical protein
MGLLVCEICAKGVERPYHDALCEYAECDEEAIDYSQLIIHFAIGHCQKLSRETIAIPMCLRQKGSSALQNT